MSKLCDKINAIPKVKERINSENLIRKYILYEIEIHRRWWSNTKAKRNIPIFIDFIYFCKDAIKYDQYLILETIVIDRNKKDVLISILKELLPDITLKNNI